MNWWTHVSSKEGKDRDLSKILDYKQSKLIFCFLFLPFLVEKHHKKETKLIHQTEKGKRRKQLQVVCSREQTTRLHRQTTSKHHQLSLFSHQNIK